MLGRDEAVMDSVPWPLGAHQLQSPGVTRVLFLGK